MNKIFLIVKREYLTRVKKKSFLITTFVFPLLMASVWIIPFWLATQPSEERIIEVVDEDGIFESHYNERSNIKFVHSDLPLEVAKIHFIEEGYSGLLYIPELDLDDPKGITFWSKQAEGYEVQGTIESILENEIERIKLKMAGIDSGILDKSKTDISLETKNFDGNNEKESNTATATWLSIILAFIIYFIIFLYGAQVMRGVVEEKTSRIVEVIISSVKPFQLMLGKILGIAGVAFTQLLLWIILTFGFGALFINLSGEGQKQAVTHQIQDQPTSMEENSMMLKAIQSIETIDFPLILGMFAIYFIGGYLLYSSLFAAIGSAVDSETDSQQFMLPITIPLAISFAVISAIIREPHGALAFWMSMIPLTSPVVMTMRLPFDVPAWQLLLSTCFLIAGFLFTTWFAGRIYRVGILMYGKKVNYKELMRWFFLKL
ncbi:MAG TPA: ABC transporter permease [Cytophagales bacterium]|nr:ABC transporter permease [Cytophagales bacterium]